jgi:hypothetical protein
MPPIRILLAPSNQAKCRYLVWTDILKKAVKSKFQYSITIQKPDGLILSKLILLLNPPKQNFSTALNTLERKTFLKALFYCCHSQTLKVLFLAMTQVERDNGEQRSKVARAHVIRKYFWEKCLLPRVPRWVFEKLPKMRPNQFF